MASAVVNSTKRTDGPSGYLRRQAERSSEGRLQLEAVKTTSTLYIGNLSFYTTEEQIYELFSKCGKVVQTIMGLDRFKKTPCGFCFVVYATHDDAIKALRYLSHTKLDDRVINIDLDPGFTEGRQYGRGISGGQVRDEFRDDYDPGRGGYNNRWDEAHQSNQPVK